MAKNLWLIKLGLGIIGRKMLKSLEKASKNCLKAQQDVLMDIINYSKDTEYGKEHKFDQIKTIEDFQKNVPINTYENLRPYIKKHTQGHSNVIVPEKPIMYATTSGTTREPKWIPITPKYYKECYNGLSKLWFYTMLKENPHLFDGNDLTIVGKAIEGYTEDGTPYGSMSGHVYGNLPKVMEWIKIVPKEVYNIDDYYSKYYILLRFTLGANITYIATGNPSTLIELHNVVTNNFDDLVADIEAGTLRKNLKISDDIRAILQSYLKPNPKKAKELRQLKEKYGTLYPKHYWPKLQVVNTWTTANSGMYLQHTTDYYPDHTVIREFGFLATEVRAGIILDNAQKPTILNCHMVFYEFIKKEDINKPNPRVYLAHELEKGELYYFFITATNGLFRYNINDIIRIDGFYNEFPMFTFIQKGEGVTTLTGEKLYETQLMDAVEETEKNKNMKTNFYIAFADFNTSSYHLYVEFKEEHTLDKYKDFCKTVDDVLKQINVEYKSKRESNRVKNMTLHLLKKDAFQHYKAICLGKGFRDGQFKLVHLQEDKDRMGIFNGLSVQEEIKYW